MVFCQFFLCFLDYTSSLWACQPCEQSCGPLIPLPRSIETAWLFQTLILEGQNKFVKSFLFRVGIKCDYLDSWVGFRRPWSKCVCLEKICRLSVIQLMCKIQCCITFFTPYTYIGSCRLRVEYSREKPVKLMVSQPQERERVWATSCWPAETPLPWNNQKT